MSGDGSDDEGPGLSVPGAKTWRRWNDIADIFDGPADTSWVSDRDLVSGEFMPTKNDNDAGARTTFVKPADCALEPAIDGGVPQPRNPRRVCRSRPEVIRSRG